MLGGSTLGYTLQWSSVNELASISDDETEVLHAYTYNDQGIRIRKVTNGTTHKYYLDGSRIIAENITTGNVTEALHYYYDVKGICGFKYNGTTYYYVKNMQGDIVAVYDGNGTKYGEYAYDAWGKCNIIYDKDGIATKNPYRYRGYYLDKETDLYYLNSRYYDPEVGRFLSADSLGYMDPERVNGLNLYAYCNNNPVMYIDPDGTEVVILSIFALLALLVSAVAVLAILDFEYRTHTIRDLFVSVGDVFGNIFNGISDFFTSFVNAKNVSLPGLDYGGYTTGNIVFSKNKNPYKPKRRGQRVQGKSKKDAEEKARKRGGGKKPIFHKGGYSKKTGRYTSRHFHPNVPEGHPYHHDHYFFSFVNIVLRLITTENEE